MKKRLLIALAVIALLVAFYAVTWFRIYNMTAGYFAEAEASFESGKYALALKGGNDFATGDFTGAYQQVVEAWEGGLALPKPQIFLDARQREQTILQEKLSVKDIDAMVKKYLKIDKRYLDAALLRKAELLLADGKTSKAIEAYESAVQVFPMNKELAQQVEAKLAELNAQQSADTP